MSGHAIRSPYPVVLDLHGRRALVVGGGPVAARKVAGLLGAGAVVTVVAPDAVVEIAEHPAVRWHRREYRRGEVASYRLAITATNDPAVDRQVARDGEAANVFVNSADDPGNCAFILPAVVRRGDLQISVSTNGRSPAMAQWARRTLESVFTDVHARTLDLLSEVRDDLRAARGTSEVAGWDDAIGDPDLLTMRAVSLLARADVIVHDRLVDERVLAWAAPWAELVDVGKTPGSRRNSQREINAVLVERGRRFETVVRLKGGDPFVFGRGGEEAEHLRAHGLEVEVVPGVSSSIAAPAAAGIPVTMRGVSSGVTIVTAHQDPDHDGHLDWTALARAGTTLVVLMGAARARSVADRLVAGGMPVTTPVAVVTSATCDGERIERLTLERLGVEPVANPSVIVIGDVASRDVLRDVPALISTALPEGALG